MAKMLPLLEGEEVVFQLEGDVYGGGGNPISQAFARFNAVVLKILGMRVKATLVVTNKRVFEFREVITCYCVPTSVDFKIVLPSSVKEVGYKKVTSCGCFPYFFLYYQSHTQSTNMPLKVSKDAEIQEYVDSFYKALNAN